MSLEVIGAGFGRTGTWSTFAALNRLGFPCYHMHEVIWNRANRGHLGFWYRVAKSPPGTQHDWSRVFAKYRAAVDFPASCVWQELMVAYPEAKVLLTLHPGGAGAWYDSTIETIYFSETMWQYKILWWLTPRGFRFGEMSRRLVWGRALKGVMGDRNRAIARYEAYSREVTASVPSDRLLVFKVTDGWEPLCDFLGVPVPDEPFPALNDRAAMKRVVRNLRYLAYLVLAGYAAAAVGLVLALDHLL